MIENPLKMQDCATASYEPQQSVEKGLIAAQFGKNANHYDAVAVVQRRIADRLIHCLLQHSHISKKGSDNILDAGCGTGYLGKRLFTALNLQSEEIEQAPAIELTALDISSEMLAVARLQSVYQSFITGDIESLGENKGARLYDLVMSSLAIQWCHDFHQTLSALQSVTKVSSDHTAHNPRYSLYLTTLASGTLQELESAFKQIDEEQHILAFLKEQTIAHTVKTLGGEVTFYSEVITFPDLKTLFKSIRAVGAASLPNRRRGLLGKNDYQKIDDYFKRLGQYQLTYRVAEIMLPGKGLVS